MARKDIDMPVFVGCLLTVFVLIATIFFLFIGFWEMAALIFLPWVVIINVYVFVLKKKSNSDDKKTANEIKDITEDF